MSAKRVLFLGEGDLSGPARYLAAVLSHAGFSWDHCPDNKPIPLAYRKRSYDAILLSDYRYAVLKGAGESWLIQALEKGAGLLMIGGWASFTGLVGRYAGTALEKWLPVRCRPGDDRMNWASGVLIQPAKEHPILSGLSFRRPPVICGYNEAIPRAGTRVVLEGRPLKFLGIVGRPAARVPLLVVQEKPRSAAFLTDCAPHWAGGLVDWGSRRIKVKVAGNEVEVGDAYLKFFRQLIQWVAQ